MLDHGRRLLAACHGPTPRNRNSLFVGDLVLVRGFPLGLPCASYKGLHGEEVDERDPFDDRHPGETGRLPGGDHPTLVAMLHVLSDVGACVGRGEAEDDHGGREDGGAATYAKEDSAGSCVRWRPSEQRWGATYPRRRWGRTCLPPYDIDGRALTSPN